MRGAVITAACLTGVLAVACGVIGYLRLPPEPGQRLSLSPATTPMAPALAPTATPQSGSRPAEAISPFTAVPPPQSIPAQRIAAGTSGEDPRPGRATPQKPADPAVYDVTWDNGRGQMLRTRIVIHAGSDPLRRPAEVATRQLGEDRDLVQYHAQAFIAAGDIIHIDARGAAVTGMYSEEWSPDSFAIHPDLSVEIMDDSHDPNRGQVTQITRE